MIDFRLNKIVIFNFACYYGKNEIDFTANTKKNIFLFNVRNGHGKTSLFHAIKWGFYGEKIPYFKDSDKISIEDFLNNKVDKKKDMYYVEIYFEYGKDTYVLKRSYKPSWRGPSQVSLIKNGRSITGSEEIDEEISQVMPLNFADFFMFDGEQLSRFMTAQSSEEYYRESVHQLLGLRQIKQLKDDLELLQRKYDNKLTELESSSDDVNQKKKVIEGLLKDITNNNLKIEKCKKKIIDNEKIIDGLEEHRNAFEDLPKVMKELERINSKILENEKKKSTIVTRLEEHSENLFLAFIKSELDSIINDDEKRIEELNDISGLSDEETDVQLAREAILKKSIPVCDVCGHHLDKSEKKELETELNKIEESMNVLRENKKERDGLKNEINMIKGFKDSIEDISFQSLIDNLDEIKTTLLDLKKQKSELDTESRREKYGSLGEINNQISILEEENNTKTNQIKLLEEQNKGIKNKKEEITKEIVRLGHDDKLTEKYSYLSTYAGKLMKSLQDALDEGTRTKREQILKKSNEIFLNITNKPDEYAGLDFENPESFSFVIKTKKGKIVPKPSKGEKQVLAMSFLLGLNQYTGRNNVILMDTPVATLDDLHSARIGKALAHLNNQVIFLAQPQELKGDIYNNMKSAIVKEFTVIRKEDSSIIDEK